MKFKLSSLFFLTLLFGSAETTSAQSSPDVPLEQAKMRMYGTECPTKEKPALIMNRQWSKKIDQPTLQELALHVPIIEEYMKRCAETDVFRLGFFLPNMDQYDRSRSFIAERRYRWGFYEEIPAIEPEYLKQNRDNDIYYDSDEIEPTDPHSYESSPSIGDLSGKEILGGVLLALGTVAVLTKLDESPADFTILPEGDCNAARKRLVQCELAGAQYNYVYSCGYVAKGENQGCNVHYWLDTYTSQCSSTYTRAAEKICSK